MRYEIMWLQIRGIIYIIVEGHLGDSSQIVASLNNNNNYIHVHNKLGSIWIVQSGIGSLLQQNSIFMSLSIPKY